MKKRNLVWLILAVSLLFNVFFTVGYFQARAQLRVAAGNGDVPRRVATALDLDEAQTQAFADLRAQRQADVALIDDGIALAQQELLELLAADEPDPVRIDALIERAADLHRQRRLAGAERFRDFIDLLTPEQRDRLRQRMHPGPPPPFGPGGRPPSLDRFDLDGDGRIDDAERAKAGEALEAHERRMREHRRAAERFDVNGNGCLDPDERKAFDDWRGRRRGPPRGGPGRRGPWPGPPPGAFPPDGAPPPPPDDDLPPPPPEDELPPDA